jgi:hypothetical protein
MKIKQVKAWNRLFANVMDVTKQQELAVLVNNLKEDTKNYKADMDAKKGTLMLADVTPAVGQPGAGGGPGQADQLLQVIRRKDDEDRRCRDEERQLQMVTKYEQVRSVCSKLMSEIEPAEVNTLSRDGLHDEAPEDVSYGAAEVNRYTVLLGQDRGVR